MAIGIFRTYVMLMSIVSINQPSGKNGASPEDDKEIDQRMKEREVTLWQHQLHLEKKVADLEARQESLARPQWELQRKIQWHTCTAFCLLVPVVFVIWRQRRNAARGEHGEETDPGFLGKVCQGVAFLTKLFVLLRAICIFIGRTLG